MSDYEHQLDLAEIARLRRMIESMRETKAIELLKDCRNELCLKCGNYKRAHLGACDGCRWRKEQVERELIE